MQENTWSLWDKISQTQIIQLQMPQNEQRFKINYTFEIFPKVSLSRQRFSSKPLEHIITRVSKQIVIHPVTLYRINVLIKTQTWRCLPTGMITGYHKKTSWTPWATCPTIFISLLHTLIFLSSEGKGKVQLNYKSTSSLIFIAIFKMDNPNHEIVLNPLMAYLADSPPPPSNN